ncbi:metalloprotease TIKI homolog [Dysidea avara]|uniref:metalloprotease TIKI homolog n=1 Tax=Dysidea avara TaxID=196820 RepID=UPI003318A302
MATSHMWSAIVTVLGCSLVFRLVSCCSSADKNSHLWQIGSNPVSYIFGTMHVPYNKLWHNIPDNVKVAFASSQDVFLELDKNDEDTMNSINNCQLLPNNDTISKYVSLRVYKRLTKYMRRLQREIPKWYGDGGNDKVAKRILGNWQRKRPIWVTLLLSSLNKEAVENNDIPLLDTFLGNAARNMGKHLKAVEDVQDQCSAFNKLDNEQAEYVMKKELDFLDEQGFEGGSDTAERDIKFYTCGDFEQMVMSDSLLPVPIHNTHNEKQQQIVNNIERLLTTHMIVKRNRKMARTIIATIKANPKKTHFFAIGAGHLVGNDSVINYLKRRGVTVQHIPSDTTIQGSQLPEDFESLGKFKTLPKNINIGDLLPTSTPPPTTPIPLGEVSTGTTTQEMSDYWQHIYHELETSATSRPTYDMTLSTISTRSISRTSPTTTTSTSPAATSSQTQEDITTTSHHNTDSPMESSSSGVMYNTTIIRTLCLITIICSRLLT